MGDRSRRSDELASDSDDEKRIYRAERRAERKIDKEKRRRVCSDDKRTSSRSECCLASSSRFSSIDLASRSEARPARRLLSSSNEEFSVKGGSNGVKGRLKSSLNFWVETLDASDFVLDMIRRGYRVPFGFNYRIQCHLFTSH